MRDKVIKDIMFSFLSSYCKKENHIQRQANYIPNNIRHHHNLLKKTTKHKICKIGTAKREYSKTHLWKSKMPAG